MLSTVRNLEMAVALSFSPGDVNQADDVGPSILVTSFTWPRTHDVTSPLIDFKVL